MQFARVARAVDFIYCYSILESNKRLESTSGSSNTANQNSTATPLIAVNPTDLGSVTGELNTFFPFDPYRLPKSAAFIKDVYRDWASVAIDNESDDEEESDEEELEEAEDANGLSGSLPEDSDRYLTIPRSRNWTSGLSREAPTRGGDGTGVISESLEQMSISPGCVGQGEGMVPSTSVISVYMS